MSRETPGEFHLFSLIIKSHRGVNDPIVIFQIELKKISVKMKKHVEVYSNVTKEVFESEISPKRRPAMLRGVDIGEATAK